MLDADQAAITIRYLEIRKGSLALLRYFETQVGRAGASYPSRPVIMRKLPLVLVVSTAPHRLKNTNPLQAAFNKNVSEAPTIKPLAVSVSPLRRAIQAAGIM